jgi:5-methylcytosine-specific restriction endonuclease McrA
MIKPILKSDQTRRSSLKAGDRVKKAVTKAEKKQRTQKVRGEVTPRLRALIFERDGGKCVLCGRKPTKTNGLELHAHHIIPVTSEGKSREENLCTLCNDCNAGAGARTLDMLRAIGHAIKPTEPSTPAQAS